VLRAQISTLCSAASLQPGHLHWHDVSVVKWISTLTRSKDMVNEVLISTGLRERWRCSFTKTKLRHLMRSTKRSWEFSTALHADGEPCVLSPWNDISSSLIICSPLHVSLSPYGFFILQPSLQPPTDHQQCLGRIQETHKERPTCTSPRYRAPILQHSQCHSFCPSAASSGVR
jgi:hypothetical protein